MLGPHVSPPDVGRLQSDGTIDGAFLHVMYPSLRMKPNGRGGAIKEMLECLRQLQQELPTHGLRSRAPGDLTRLSLQLLEAAAEVTVALRSTRARMAADRAKAEGTALGRPRHAQVDATAIVCDIGDGVSVSSTAKRHGIARATVRTIVAQEIAHTVAEARTEASGILREAEHTLEQARAQAGDIVADAEKKARAILAAERPDHPTRGRRLSGQDHREIMLAVMIAIERERKVVEGLESEEGWPRRKGPVAERLQQIARFERLLEKLRR